MISGGILYCIFTILIFRKFSLGIWWYNATHLLAVGMIWAVYEDKILKFLKKFYYIVTPFILFTFIVLFDKNYDILNMFNFESAPLILAIILTCLFTLSFLLISLKINFGNRVLDFLGDMSLEIYMTHGLFTRVLRSKFLYIENDSFWAVSVLFGTIILSFVLHKYFVFILSKYKQLLAKGA